MSALIRHCLLVLLAPLSVASATELALPVGVPGEYHAEIKRALMQAGENTAQIRRAIEYVREGQRPAMCFLIANMPAHDLQSLSAEYLLTNVKEAYEARAQSQWSARIPEALFLNYVLPYASINERRDDWRTDFRQRFTAIANKSQTMSEAAARLNETIFENLGVQYNASKTRKPDQSPYESTELGYATCTGLSVLLINACRAVGIPARFVGTAEWTTHRGNHSWVEIWDGQWAVIGAAEPDPRGVNHVWFTDRAAKAKPGHEHGVFAASFRRTDTHFPMIWDRARTDVPANDITRQYTDASTVQVRARRGPDSDQPVAGRVVVYWQGEPYAIADLADKSDAMAELRLPRQTALKLAFTRTDGQVVQRDLRLDEGDQPQLTINASDIATQIRQYRCHFTPQPPTLDGKLDDSAWQAAPWTEAFVDIRGPAYPTPRHATRMKMLWDDKYLYVAAELTEPHVWATLKERDQVVWHDNDFEIFIDPDGDTREYYEIQVNAFNTVFDLFLVRTYIDGGPALHDWDMRGLITAVHVDGTLNDPSDTDHGWSVEFALPWRSLAEAARVPTPPRTGDEWRMNFSRVQWRHEVVAGAYRKVPDTREDNWVWSPQGVINMHLPVTWGRVIFERATP